MTAGVGNAVYLDANDSAGSGIGRKVRSQACVDDIGYYVCDDE